MEPPEWMFHTREEKLTGRDQRGIIRDQKTEKAGNRQQATGNRQQATGNRQQATGPIPIWIWDKRVYAREEATSGGPTG